MKCDSDTGARIEMRCWFLLKEQKLPSSSGRKVRKFMCHMSIIADDQRHVLQLVSYGLILPSFIVSCVCAITHGEVDRVRELLKGLDRVSVQDRCKLGVWRLEQETASGVYLRCIHMSRKTFGLILHHGSSQHAGAKPFIDSCLNNDFRFHGADNGIPPKPSAVARDLVGSKALLARQGQPAYVCCEPFVLLQLLEIA